MIPAITTNPKFQNVIVSTGNILNVNNKLGRKSNEELLDGLKLTLLCNDANNHVELKELDSQVLRATQELNQKLTENERVAISIGAKIFLNKNSNESIEQSVKSLLEILQVEHVDNVVLAYHPNAIPTTSTSSTPSTPNPSSESQDGGGGGGFKWNSRNEQTVKELKQLWKTLENFAQAKKISQLGISDLDIETLTELHESARIQPAIAQINLANCCVVPPALQEFCNQNDIQLLTHSDPELLVAPEQFIIPGYAVDWCIRYQVHVRCRGVLTAKGYILGASKQVEETA